MATLLTLPQRKALQRLDEDHTLTGVDSRVRRVLLNAGLIVRTLDGDGEYELTDDGRDSIGIRTCDHCNRRATWQVDVYAYDGDMLERVRYCDVRLGERWAVEPETIARVERLGLLSGMHVINA